MSNSFSPVTSRNCVHQLQLEPIQDNLSKELHRLERRAQYTEQNQGAVGSLASTISGADGKPQQTKRRYIFFGVPEVVQRFIAVLLVPAILICMMTVPAYAQDGTSDTATVSSAPDEKSKADSAPEYSVSSYMETTSMTTRILNKPSVTGALVEQIGKYKAVGVIEVDAGNGAFTEVVFLDADGNPQVGFVMEAFLGEPTTKGEESLIALQESLAPATEVIRRIVIFQSRQEVFEDPEDMTSKTGEILSKGAHIATQQRDINEISWVYIEDEGWVIKAVEHMNVILGEDSRDLEAGEALTLEEQRIGKLDKKVTPYRDLNVRDEPGAEGSSIVGIATEGTEYVALELDEDSIPGATWARIELADGTIGWVAVFSSGTQFSQLIDPNPPVGRISSEDQAELDKNLDTDWAKPEIKQRALEVAQAFDPNIAHAEFTTVEGRRYYHQLVFFDRDGNVLYQTAISGSGAEATVELFAVDEDGTIDPTAPVAVEGNAGWEVPQEETAERDQEATEISATEAEAQTRDLYPEELFTNIEAEGGTYWYDAEMGIFQAALDGHTYLLLPRASANDPSKDAENAFFLYDAPDKQTLSSSEEKVFITVAAEKDNFVTSGNMPGKEPVEFNPKLLRRQDLIDQFIRDYLHDYPEGFYPGDGEPPVHFVLGLTDEDGSLYEWREDQEVKELDVRGGIELRLLATARPDGGTSFVAALYLPLDWLKGNYIVDSTSGKQWEYGRQEYLQYPLEAIFQTAIAEGIRYAYTGEMPTSPKTEEERAEWAKRAYGVQEQLGEFEGIVSMNFNLDRILTEYYGLTPQRE